MDVIHHGEEAYATGEGAILVAPRRTEERVPAADPLGAGHAAGPGYRLSR